MRGMRACVCVLAVGQALETPCSAYKFMYFFLFLIWILFGGFQATGYQRVIFECPNNYPLSA